MTQDNTTTFPNVAELVASAIAVRETLDKPALDLSTDAEEALDQKFYDALDRVEGAQIGSINDAINKARAALKFDAKGFQAMKEGDLAARLCAQVIEWLETADQAEAAREIAPKCPVVELGEAVALNERRVLEVDATDLGETGEERLLFDLDEAHDCRMALRDLITHTPATSLDGAAIQIALIDGYADDLETLESTKERNKARRAIRRLVYSALATVQDRVEADCHVSSLFLPDCENPFKPAKWRSQMARQEESAALAEVEAYKRRSNAQA